MSKRIVSLGYARVHFDTVGRHLLVDTDTLRRHPVEDSWDDQDDEDVGAEEFGYDPDDDDDFGDDDWDDDDDFGDDDDDDDDFGDDDDDDDFGDEDDDDFGDDDDDEEFGARRRRRRRRRSRGRARRSQGRGKRRGRGKGRGKGQGKDRGKGRGKGRGKSKKRNRTKTGGPMGWAATIVSGSDTSTSESGGPVSAQIRLQHDFESEDVIITSTDEGAKVTAIYFGDKLVFNAPDGLDLSIFAANSFVRKLVKGQQLEGGLDIIVQGTLTCAASLNAALTGWKRSK